MVVKRISGPLVVLVFWIGALAWLLLDDQYQLFLAPRFGFLIYISLGACAVFCISLLAEPPGSGKDQLIKGMILLLPIVFMGAAGDSTLGSFALSKRSLTVAQKNSETGPVLGPVSEKGGEQDQDAIREISLAHLVRNWDKYNGRHIRVEGLFSKTIEGHDQLAAVFRYFITCCAADAMPVGVFLDSLPDTGDTDLKDNDWVRISGRVVMKQLDGYDIIFMETPKIEKTDKPAKNAAYIFD
ncbi:MAG: TIGR03943 family protein [Desulfobacteraceae bacterium]|nr:TIGR03943 family protein [Desulfobacteraceae bacterium]